MSDQSFGKRMKGKFAEGWNEEAKAQMADGWAAWLGRWTAGAIFFIIGSAIMGLNVRQCIGILFLVMAADIWRMKGLAR